MGKRAGVSPFLTALMVANGANAGNLSPFSAVGVIANSAMARAGIVGFEGRVWFANFAAHVLVAGAAYALVWRRRGGAAPDDAPARRPPRSSRCPPAAAHAGVIVAWIAGVLALNLSLGLSAFAVAAVILLWQRVRRAGGDEADAVGRSS